VKEGGPTKRVETDSAGLWKWTEADESLAAAPLTQALYYK